MGTAAASALSELKNCLVAGDREGVLEKAGSILENKGTAEQILNGALIPGMAEVGEKMGRQEMFIPEVLLAARAMQAALEVLKPILSKNQVHAKGTVVLGTVLGDIHDIGKNLVGNMLEGAGFKVVDLGVNVDSGKFISAIKEHAPDVVGMSAMLTTTMQEMLTAINQMAKDNVRKKVKVIVGGAPVNLRFAMDIGADGYAVSASTVVQEVNKLLSDKGPNV